ncbi:MAG: SdrD B-like domain-containing protein [Acidimicrobiia bacterium]|nr:SdrD B-like domain-containing protein [Acidimicrobiia bacterium]
MAAFVVLLSAVVLVPGSEIADAAGETFEVEKTVDHNTIVAGAVSTWTLTIDTNEEVALASGVTVTDVVPDGLCPYGAGSPDCPGGVSPSPAYTSATENSDGTWTLAWDLPDMGTSEQVIITYTTLTRSHYREGFATAGPVLARDSWNNLAHLSGTVDGAQMDDYSSAGQSAGSFSLTKSIANRPGTLTAPAVCGDGTGLDWQPIQGDGYRIGDQVCWRIAIDYPSGVATRGTTISDVIPVGQVFTAGDTWAPGAGNTVPIGDIDGSANGPGDTSLSWNVGDGAGDVAADSRLEIVYSTTITNPGSTASGQTVANAVDASHTNTSGGSFGASASARAEVLEPELDLLKGVWALNGTPVGGGDNVDGVQVMQGDVVTYQIKVTNTGDIAADNVEVWDLLPVWFATCSSNVSAISDGGVCVDGANRIEWTGPAVFSVPAGAAVIRTYDVTIPPGISPKQNLENRAGVRSFTSATNNGSGTFTHVPVSNIDPAVGTQNTQAADDISNVVTADPTISHAQLTGVGEAGNDLIWQAAIGELITYTITVTIPEGTTVYNADLFDDLPVNLDLVSSSHTFTGEEAVSRVEDAAADSVTVTWPAPSYTNAPGSGLDTLNLTVVGRVLDIPTNSRGTVIGNTPEFTWFDQAGVESDLEATVTTTVVEPLITIDKSSTDSYGNDGVVIGGETVQYSLDVGNTGLPNVSTAHDVIVVDTVPEGLTPTTINDGGAWVADPTPGNGIGGTITWTVPSQEPGAPLTLTYWVAVDNPVVVSSVFTNTVAVTATSLSGPVGGERIAGPGYQANDLATLVSPLLSMAKSVIPTSATIGEEVSYSLAVTVPAGMIMYDATILDVLPADMVFIGIDAVSCAMGAGTCSPGISVENVYQSGQTTSFFLGDIDQPATETRIFTITYDAYVADVGVAGDLPTNQATIYGNTVDLLPSDPGYTTGPFHVATGPVESSVRLIEPDLAIDKRVAGQIGDSDYRRAQPGQTLYYTLVVSNDSGLYVAPAYDVIVVDQIPDNVSDPTSIFGGGVWDPGLRTITWTIPGPLAAGTSVALDYEFTTSPTLDWNDENPGGAELVNTADITGYYGVPEAQRIAEGHDYRHYTATPADVVSVELDLAELGDLVWFDVNNNGVFDVGEPPLAGVGVTITYHGPDGALGTGDDEVFAGVTAGDGSYGRDQLPGGVYTVLVDDTDIPAGLVPSYNLDPTVDHVWSGVLGEAESNVDVDFGYTGTGSIGDTIWFDIDADGAVDGSEYGLEGVTVTANWLGLDGIRNGDDIAYTTATDGSGAYLLSDLPAGLYEVEVDTGTLPSGMNPTFDADGIATPNTSGFLLAGAENESGADFGYAGTGSIGDLVWLDKDGMGDIDPTEPWLYGVPLQLTWPGEDGVLGGGDDELFLTSTGIGGFYLFDNLPSGEYQLDVLGGLPAAAVNTWDADGGGDSSVVINLSNGEVFAIGDFGYQGTASIGDRVWWDMDADGVIDVGEPGIPGVDIALTYAGIDGVPGNADDLLFTTTTDATGSYLFTDLPQGDYVVAVIGGAPAGMALTHDDNGPLDGTSAVNGLGDAVIYLDADFGYNGTGSIGDLVWLDLSIDGVQDAAEPGIPGVDVGLVWNGVDGLAGTGDDVTLSTATDIDGNYSFSGLPDGGYRLTIDPGTVPLGLVPTSDSDGTGTPHTAYLVLGPAEHNSDQDFGYVGQASVGDTVWFDRDSDGVLGVDEYGLGGVTIDLQWDGPDATFGTLDDESFPITTTMTGHYLLGGLPAGDYVVAIDVATLPAGMVAVFDADGTLDDRTNVTLNPVTSHRTADFGYRGSGQIGDLVWLDLDGNGTQDPAEPGLVAQTLEIVWEGPDGTMATADDQTYDVATDSSGDYSLHSLPPGRYEVTVTGHIVTAAGNSHDEDADLDSHTSVVLGDGASHDSADFGYAGSASIGDLVWLDLDGDGLAGVPEPGLETVELTVTWYGADGIRGGADDVVLPVHTTDAAGSYVVSGLPAGSYRVAVTGGVPAGLVNSGDEDGNHDEEIEVVGLATGNSYNTADFGYAGQSSVEATLWWDLDGNGIIGTSEPGLEGLGVQVDWAGFDGVAGNGDDAAFGVSSVGAGIHVFDHLPPGDYRITVDETGLPPGVAQSADPDGTVDGETTLTLDDLGGSTAVEFGYRGSSSVGGTVWWDVNRDGIADAGEPGVPDVNIDVTYFGVDDTAGGGDDVRFVATADGSGSYLIPGLPSGFYDAIVDETTLPEGSTANSDRDGGEPGTTQFTLGTGTFESDIDFAVVGNAVLSGRVWNDRDGDGAIGASEVGIAGVNVVTTWLDGTAPVVVSASSDAFGNWEISSLPPGEYVVTADPASVPLEMALTTEEMTSVTVAMGEAESVDIGLALLLEINAMIWHDRDGDGSIDSGEGGIPGVLVNLYDELGILVGIAESGPDGYYGFGSLLPGEYLVELDRGSIPEGFLATSDRDGVADLHTMLDLTEGSSVLDAHFGFQVGLPVTGLNLVWFAMWGALLMAFGCALVTATAGRGYPLDRR